MRTLAMRSGVLKLFRGGFSGESVRHFETGTGTSLPGHAGPVHQSESAVLHSLVGGMAKHARGIPIQGDRVEVLETPSQFYNVLLQGVRNARTRVVIASLYIGTGTLEQELLDVIADSLARKPNLQVTILCDALRTTRPSAESSDRYASSGAMLAHILLSDRAPWRKATNWERPNEPVRVALYHTPMLSQVLKLALPSRAQEIVGVCHLKAFVFDDNVIMTGANMSSSYFTVRQDRYLCFPDCKNLASHFCSLINTVALYSYTLDSTGQLQPRSAHLDPVAESDLFCSELSDSVKDLTLPTASADHSVDAVDTWVFPTVQMGPLGIRQDEQALLWLLKQLPAGTDLHLSSPYFNLTPAYEDAILDAAREKSVQILTASPKANGFYGSSGVAGLIPLAYSLLEQRLHSRAMAMDDDNKEEKEEKSRAKARSGGGLSIHEYERLGWTFHAKGLWCSLPGADDGPNMTLVGSSNLGYRSRDRDLEAQLFLFTLAPRLQQQLERERDDLFVRASKVTPSLFCGPDRQAGLLASLALNFVKPWL